MTAMPINQPEPDYAKCEQVFESIQKIMELNPPSIDWMTGEFANQMLTTIHAAYTFLFMEFLKRGMPQEEAEQSAQMQAPLLAFQLGMQVGADMEGARGLRELFGE